MNFSAPLPKQPGPAEFVRELRGVLTNVEFDWRGPHEANLDYKHLLCQLIVKYEALLPQTALLGPRGYAFEASIIERCLQCGAAAVAECREHGPACEKCGDPCAQHLPRTQGGSWL